MTNGLSEAKVTWLTYLVYLLLFLLTSITAWQQVTIAKMPEVYVRLERYKADVDARDCSLTRIELKLDKLIDKHLNARRTQQ